MVINHPLDGTASATAHHAVLNFYKSYPGLYTAQFLMRRGSITPSMQFAFELLVYSIADTAYNIILSLASGYYNYEKLKRALEKRELNYRETLRLLMKYPLFSNNLFGFGLQATIQAFTGGSQDKIIGSIAENAIGYDIRNFIRALQSWSAYISGDIPKDHPMMATYNAMGRLFPVLSNTLVKMLLMQSFGDISSSGRRTGSRSRSSYILDKIGAVSDDSIREKAVRGIFKDSEYNPVDKRTFDGQYRQSKIYDPIFNTAVEKAKEQAVPKETRQPQVKQPKVPQNKQPSIEEQGTTPYAPPEEAFE